MNAFSFKIPIIMQDITGLMSFTLFDCDAKKLLQKTTQELLHQFYELSSLNSELIIEILSKTSLQTFVTLRCRNNVVFGVIIQQKKNPWANIEDQFIPASGGKNLDLDCLPNTCTILASSLCGIILCECYNPDEYIVKFLFVFKPTTLDAK
uniref:Uncharacterized protein n=1 Tax=Lactuca sativa TaxID=4236 RepID=A0A9R1XG35_LACSA|nr:hypothetical protein LSAT_V11C400221190 [Lactuca sativa]